MFLFQGSKCPYCDQPFEKNDDLAVCPECGTPHHRACYKEHGQCANADKHAAGFEWKAADAPISHDTRTCPRCHRETDANGHFCSYCGYQFTHAAANPGAPAPQMPPLFGGPFGMNGQQRPMPDSLLFRNEDGSTERLSMSDSIFGIPARDWVTYVGTSVSYYLYHIRRQEKTGKKGSFTLSAALFPFIYFLYRRMWSWAAIAFAVNFILGIPSILVTAAQFAGLSLGGYASLLTLLSSVCSMLNIASCMAWGTFAVYLYRKQALKTFAALRAESASEEEYRQKLQRISGPSVLAVNILFGAFFLLSVLITPLLSL